MISLHAFAFRDLDSLFFHHVFKQYLVISITYLVVSITYLVVSITYTC